MMVLLYVVITTNIENRIVVVFQDIRNRVIR